MNRESSYEGLQTKVRVLKLPDIEVWENKYADRDYRINIETDEFTCICPKTGLPDFAHIQIEYIPRARCVELKSFKEYLTAFRPVGIFHEHVTNRIFDDFIRAADPVWAKISTRFNIRGGIATSVTREYSGGTKGKRR